MPTDRELLVPKKIEPGSEMHLTLLGVPMAWNFLVGQDRKDMLDYGRAVYAAALEDAARRCDALAVALDNAGNPYRREADASRCAAAIRAAASLATPKDPS